MAPHDDPTPSSQEYFSRADRGKAERVQKKNAEHPDLRNLKLTVLKGQTKQEKKKEKNPIGPQATAEALQHEQDRQDAKNAEASEEFPQERTV